MTDFQTIYDEADKAGRAAGDALTPRPCVFGQAKSLTSDEIDTSQPVYFEAEGACGFAWVRFPGNTAFARWAKKAKVARTSYPSGLQISCQLYNQSVQRKEAYTEAFAKVLQSHGITAYAESRLD
jgi:hypothetical protein